MPENSEQRHGWSWRNNCSSNSVLPELRGTGGPLAVAPCFGQVTLWPPRTDALPASFGDFSAGPSSIRCPVAPLAAWQLLRAFPGPAGTSAASPRSLFSMPCQFWLFHRGCFPDAVTPSTTCRTDLAARGLRAARDVGAVTPSSPPAKSRWLALGPATSPVWASCPDVRDPDHPISEVPSSADAGVQQCC